MEQKPNSVFKFRFSLRTPEYQSALVLYYQMITGGEVADWIQISNRDRMLHISYQHAFKFRRITRVREQTACESKWRKTTQECLDSKQLDKSPAKQTCGYTKREWKVESFTVSEFIASVTERVVSQVAQLPSRPLAPKPSHPNTNSPKSHIVPLQTRPSPKLTLYPHHNLPWCSSQFVSGCKVMNFST